MPAQDVPLSVLLIGGAGLGLEAALAFGQAPLLVVLWSGLVLVLLGRLALNGMASAVSLCGLAAVWALAGLAIGPHLSPTLALVHALILVSASGAMGLALVGMPPAAWVFAPSATITAMIGLAFAGGGLASFGILLALGIMAIAMTLALHVAMDHLPADP